MNKEKYILAVSGSASLESSNTALLKSVKNTFDRQFNIQVYEGLRDLPLFAPERLKDKNAAVEEWKKLIAEAAAVVFCTPEYSHNIPAVVKNGLEWITQSGELTDKPVLAVTFTPKAPRGEYAMKSLLFSLQTLKARVVTQMPLYRDEVNYENGPVELSDDYRIFWEEALGMLVGE